MTQFTEQAYEALKKTREARDLSLSDVANALHLTVPIIEQIEAGNFKHQRLAPVFMRGYIRAYAKYLNLPNELSDNIVSELAIDTPLQRPVVQSEPGRTQKQSAPNFRKVVGYAFVMTILVCLGFVWQNIANTPAKTASENTPVEQLTADNHALVAPEIPTETTQDTPTPDPTTTPEAVENSETLTQSVPTETPEDLAPTETPETTEPPESIAPAPAVIATPAAPVVVPIVPPVVKAPQKTIPAVPVENAEETL